MLLDTFYSLSFETQIFLVTIVLFALIFHVTYTPATAEKAPAFLTTLGIFGTFVGIAIGLMEFNTVDISASVPKLIEGIKTAVWASAGGIFAALTVKMRDIEGFSKRRRSPVKKANIDDLIAALKAVENALKDSQRVTEKPAAEELKPVPLRELPIEMPRKPVPPQPDMEVNENAAPENNMAGHKSPHRF